MNEVAMEAITAFQMEIEETLPKVIELTREIESWDGLEEEMTEMGESAWYEIALKIIDECHWAYQNRDLMEEKLLLSMKEKIVVEKKLNEATNADVEKTKQIEKETTE